MQFFSPRAVSAVSFAARRPFSPRVNTNHVSRAHRPYAVHKCINMHNRGICPLSISIPSLILPFKKGSLSGYYASSFKGRWLAAGKTEGFNPTTVGSFAIYKMPIDEQEKIMRNRLNAEKRVVHTTS